MNEDAYDDEPNCARPGVAQQRALVVDVLFVGLRCTGNIIDEIAAGVHMLGNIAAAHANWRRARGDLERMADLLGEESS